MAEVHSVYMVGSYGAATHVISPITGQTLLEKVSLWFPPLYLPYAKYITNGHGQQSPMIFDFNCYILQLLLQH
jgi:hypothetical protein